MRKMLASILVGCAFLAAPAGASAATTGTTDQLDIGFTWYWTGESWAQEFVATGAVEDSGWYGGRQVGVGTTGRTTLHGRDGAITIRWYQTETETDPFGESVHVTGTWRITWGTRAYAGLRGNGTFDQDVTRIESAVGSLSYHGRIAAA
jgi:hypothetical protein